MLKWFARAWNFAFNSLFAYLLFLVGFPSPGTKTDAASTDGASVKHLLQHFKHSHNWTPCRTGLMQGSAEIPVLENAARSKMQR